MKNRYHLNNHSSEQTFQIIEKIRMKTQIELNENANNSNQISFRDLPMAVTTQIQKDKLNSNQTNTNTNTNANANTFANKNLNKNQKVTIFFSKGLKYQGEVCDEKFNGFGIISKDSIELYVGEFKKGSFHGFGRLMNSQEIENGGEIVFDDWVAYSGEFKEGLFHGMGTIILQNNQKFLGRFEEGKLVKEGVYNTSQKVFVGEWN